MTCDPRTINYSNLKDKDKQIIIHQLLMLEELNDLIGQYEIEREITESTLQTISYEEGIRALEEAKRVMLDYIIDMMTSIIDSYPEDIEPIDTDDYFYGIKENNFA